MARVPPDHEDLRRLLSTHCGFIIRSMEGVIDGVEEEALRIAVSVRVLLHDTGRSVSLLQQLGWKQALFFLDTRSRSPFSLRNADTGEWVTSDLGLAVVAGEPWTWVPPCGEAPHDRPPLKFDEWWTAPLFPWWKEAGDLSRSLLIRDMANAGGGAHVAPGGVLASVDDLTRRGLGMQRSYQLPADGRLPQDGAELGDPTYPAGNATSASVAQVGYEVLQALVTSQLCPAELAQHGIMATE